MEAAVVAAAVVMLLPRLKAKPPTELLAVVTETVAVGLPAAKLGGCSVIALWSGKMPSILLSLFLCRILSDCSSFSPMTCPVLLFLGAGVPRISAGEATWIPPLLPDLAVFSTLFLASASSASVMVLSGLPGDELLSSLCFRTLFLIFSSSSLSGDRNTLVFRGRAGVGVFSSFSDLSLSSSSSWSLVLFSRHLELDRLAWMARLRLWSELTAGSGRALDTVWDWALAVVLWWSGATAGSVTLCPNRVWLRERREPRERSWVSRDTRWEVVWPTTPDWNSGGISMDSEEPSELELSRRALLDPVTDSSEGLRVRLPTLKIKNLMNTFGKIKSTEFEISPESSARTAMTCLGSVLLCSSLCAPGHAPAPPRVKGL